MRFVVKIGSNLLTKEDNSLDRDFIKTMVDQIAKLHQVGHEPMIVTSGAVAAGRQRISFKKESKNIPYRQALASVGQPFLMDTYRGYFDQYDISIGQVLLTMGDFNHRKNFMSTRKTLKLLLDSRVIPVINENDVTTFDELKFGDNDNVSAQVASLLHSKALIILTDVEGLYDKNPQKYDDAQLIPNVQEITDDIKKMATEEKGCKGTGGMASKVRAAQYATEAGVDVWVANGTIKNIIVDIIEGQKHHGTCFHKQFDSKEARLKWLQLHQKEGAAIIVDKGAEKALLELGKSLLCSGVKEVAGEFERGDVVAIEDANGKKLGFGKVNYNHREVDLLKGSHSEEIADILGYALEDELIHRDNMVT